MTRNVRFMAILTAAMTVLIFGTVFFHYVEGWSFLDAWFFTVVTVSTVGYGNLVPATVIGKIATGLMIFTGIGIFAALFTMIGQNSVAHEQRRLEQQLKKLERRRRGAGAPENQPPRND